jgi:hypothetical protein
MLTLLVTPSAPQVIAVTPSEWDDSKFYIETLKETLELRVDTAADKVAWTQAILAHKAFHARAAADAVLRSARASTPGAPSGALVAAVAPERLPAAAVATCAAIRGALAAAGTPAAALDFALEQVVMLADEFSAQLAAERRRRGALRARVRHLQGDKAQLECTVVQARRERYAACALALHASDGVFACARRRPTALMWRLLPRQRPQPRLPRCRGAPRTSPRPLSAQHAAAAPAAARCTHAA